MRLENGTSLRWLQSSRVKRKSPDQTEVTLHLTPLPATLDTMRRVTFWRQVTCAVFGSASNDQHVAMQHALCTPFV